MGVASAGKAGERAVARLAQRVFEAGPEAMRPDWLADTWKGTHGPGRIRVVGTTVDTALTFTEGGLIGRASVKGRTEVTARSTLGAFQHNVGSFTRSISLHDTGRLTIDHSYMALDEMAQGHDFATGFNGRAFRRYKKAGVDDVTIHASLSVGGYAWARQGFELKHADVAERAAKIREIVTGRRSKLTAKEFAKIESRLLPADGVVQPNTLTSIGDLAAIPRIGKKVLLGNDWYGVKDLGQTRPWWSRTPPPKGAPAATPAWLRSDTPSGVRDAGRGIASLLPPALDPTISLRTLERQRLADGLRLAGDSSKTTTTLAYQGQQAQLSASQGFKVHGPDGTHVGEASASLSYNGEGRLTGRFNINVPEDSQRKAVAEALRRGWRELGVEVAVDGATRHSRQLV